MKKLIFIAILLTTISAHAQVTLQQCVDAARENYPLIARYGLLEQTAAVSLSDINKSWLPQIGAYAQGTAQNAVPEFPERLQQMVPDLQGLGKLQYKIGLELNQNIWDGGQSKSRRSIQRAQTEADRASLDVQLYAVRERVESLFFGALLAGEQVSQFDLSIELLEANIRRMKSMLQNGTAMRADVDMLEAQLLTTTQQRAQASSAATNCRRLLAIFTGLDLENQTLVKPEATMPETLTADRPELVMFDAKNQLFATQEEDIETSLMPRVGFFAQAFYGYPGFDNFKSMMDRTTTFNVVAGLKVSWNIGGLYTKDNRRQRLRLASESVGNDREVFLFNNRLQATGQTDKIEEIRRVMADDQRIIELRGNVRRAAESQLQNGVIDATALLTKITDENQARLTAAYHEIQLLQSIYQLKYTLNR